MLNPGYENKKIINILITLTNIRSDAIVDSLVHHYCYGDSVSVCAEHNHIDVANIHRAMRKIEVIHDKIEKINRLKCGLDIDE